MTPSPDEPGIASRPPVILAVDDSRTQLALLEFALLQAGFQVHTAHDAAEGLASARKQRPDAVISDVLMPEMDGFAFCRALLGEPELRRVPVILLTGLTSPDDILRGLECGASGFISKPCEDAFLVDTVRRAIASQKLRAEGGLPGSQGISYCGKAYTVDADPRLVLELLLSTYANAVRQNAELVRIREALRDSNTELERRVRERTAALEAEIAVRVQAEERLLQMATHDSNTGLANRTRCMDQLADAIAQATRYGHLGAVLFLDLDGFKLVNDRHGHAVGDLLLREVGRRLVGAVRCTDTVARVGGDEFVVVLGRVEAVAQATATAERILEQLRTPMEIGGPTCTVGASVGISIFPSDGITPDQLMRRADMAMYAVKQSGGGGLRHARGKTLPPGSGGKQRSHHGKR